MGGGDVIAAACVCCRLRLRAAAHAAQLLVLHVSRLVCQVSCTPTDVVGHCTALVTIGGRGAALHVLPEEL